MLFALLFVFRKMENRKLSSLKYGENQIIYLSVYSIFKTALYCFYLYVCALSERVEVKACFNQLIVFFFQ